MVPPKHNVVRRATWNGHVAARNAQPPSRMVNAYFCARETVRLERPMTRGSPAVPGTPGRSWGPWRERQALQTALIERQEQRAVEQLLATISTEVDPLDRNRDVVRERIQTLVEATLAGRGSPAGIDPAVVAHSRIRPSPSASTSAAYCCWIPGPSTSIDWRPQSRRWSGRTAKAAKATFRAIKVPESGLRGR